MKKLYLFLSFIILLTGCASYDLQEAMRPNNREFYPKLPNMESLFETGKSVNIYTSASNINTTSIQLNNEFATLFRREVEKNLIDMNGSIKGKLVLDPVYFENEPNNAWLFTLYPLLFIPPALGVPLNSYTAKWELELNVLDKNGKRIARYSGEAEDTEYLAAYWGWEDPYTVAAFESYKQALNKIIIQLKNDIPTLSAKLKQ